MSGASTLLSNANLQELDFGKGEARTAQVTSEDLDVEALRNEAPALPVGREDVERGGFCWGDFVAEKGGEVALRCGGEREDAVDVALAKVALVGFHKVVH